ncbi:MAG: hypothetical protein WC159_07965 [Sphaerochaetaceae bacterium]
MSKSAKANRIKTNPENQTHLIPLTIPKSLDSLGKEWIGKSLCPTKTQEKRMVWNPINGNTNQKSP